jgi:tight adherence protein C
VDFTWIRDRITNLDVRSVETYTGFDLLTVGSFLAITLVAFLLLSFLFVSAPEQVLDPRRRSRSTFGFLTRPLAAAIPQPHSAHERIQLDLNRAGFYKPTALIDFLATRNLLTVLVLVVFGALAVTAEPGTGWPETFGILALVIGILGFSLPRMILASQANARLARIERGLPDALDMLSMCLTGGVGLHRAMQRVSEELSFAHSDIALEFEIIRRQAEANTLGTALRNFANRFDHPDINSLAALVTQAEKMGTNVAGAVTDFADGLRMHHRQRAEEKASKTSVLLMLPIVLCLLPPVFILLGGPPILKLKNFIQRENEPGGVLNPAASVQGQEV